MTTKYTFITPIYRGARFDDHSLPLDLLEDLSAYRDLVVEVARSLFRRRHPTRKRLPKNFAHKFVLALRGIDEGSAAPRIERVFPSGQTWLRGAVDVFDEARDVISQCFQAANDNRVVPELFPRELLWRFNTIGQNLRSDESIEWRSPDTEQGPRFDHEIRKRLILSSSTTYQQAISVVGRVVAHDEERRRFDVRLRDGQRISATFDAELLSTVRSVLAASDPVVQLSGVGEFDSSDRLKAVARTYELVLVSNEVDPDIDARIEELRQLDNGWFDGQGIAPTGAGLDQLTEVLAQLVRTEGVRAPYLYPTPEGEVRAEWSFDQFEVSAEFAYDMSTVWLHAASTRATFADEKTVSTADAAAIAAFIKQFDARKGDTA